MSRIGSNLCVRSSMQSTGVDGDPALSSTGGCRSAEQRRSEPVRDHFERATVDSATARYRRMTARASGRENGDGHGSHVQGRTGSTATSGISATRRQALMDRIERAIERLRSQTTSVLVGLGLSNDVVELATMDPQQLVARLNRYIHDLQYIQIIQEGGNPGYFDLAAGDLNEAIIVGSSRLRNASPAEYIAALRTARERLTAAREEFTREVTAAVQELQQQGVVR